MSSDGTYQFERSDLETILFADNAIVRSRFQEGFADLIQQFLDESDRVCAHLCSFGSVLTADLRAAWVEKFVFSVATYVLIAIVKKELQLDASRYTCLQILSVSVFEKTPRR